MSEPILQGFISYRRNQLEYAELLSERFEKSLSGHAHLEGITLFRDLKSQKMGEDWRRQLAGALATSCIFVVIVTQDWFMSQTCRDEYRLFRQSQDELIQHFAPNMTLRERKETIDNLVVAFIPESITERFRKSLTKGRDTVGLQILTEFEAQHAIQPDSWKDVTLKQRVEDFSLKHAPDVAERLAQTFESLTDRDDFEDARELVLRYLSDNEKFVRARAEGVFERIEHIDAKVEETPDYGTPEWIKHHRMRSVSQEQLDRKLGKLADLSFISIPLQSETLVLTDDSITSAAISKHTELDIAMEPGAMTYDFSEAFTPETVSKLVTAVIDENLSLPNQSQAEELLELLEKKGNAEAFRLQHPPRTLWIKNGNNEPEIRGTRLKEECAPVYLRWTDHE